MSADYNGESNAKNAA